jgi:hypothetical protein
MDFTVSSDGHGGTMIQDPPGTLTISNGTNQVTLNLLGNYIGASWMLSQDGGTGTLAKDPTVSG